MNGTLRPYAWTTLITRSSYLAGVLMLAHTLRKSRTPYPLVVLYTSTLPRSSVEALEREATHSNIVLTHIQALLPRDNLHVTLIAERFADTWTKLMCFGPNLFKYDKVCYLDADMIIRKNMDEVFDMQLPGRDWLAANHACVCNKDRDAWAPSDWTEDNCAYTPLRHPAALTHPTQVNPESRPTYHLLNSGMFVYHPGQRLWDDMMQFFNTTSKLAEFKFPDQDFLAEFFSDRWMSIGWQYNALKTMRYWHPAMWNDESVSCLHYIVDKPWAKRIGSDGRAGYLGHDGETHQWWWNEYESWRNERQRQGEVALLKTTEAYVAKPTASATDENEELKAVGSQVQAFADNKSKGQIQKVTSQIQQAA